MSTRKQGGYGYSNIFHLAEALYFLIETLGLRSAIYTTTFQLGVLDDPFWIALPLSGRRIKIHR
jgi:hypothetical protein